MLYSYNEVTTVLVFLFKSLHTMNRSCNPRVLLRKLDKELPHLVQYLIDQRISTDLKLRSSDHVTVRLFITKLFDTFYDQLS